jgi:hypothetical protein
MMAFDVLHQRLFIRSMSLPPDSCSIPLQFSPARIGSSLLPLRSDSSPAQCRCNMHVDMLVLQLPYHASIRLLLVAVAGAMLPALVR